MTFEVSLVIKHDNMTNEPAAKRTKQSLTPFIKVFAGPTTNAQKVTILLELLHLEYTYRATEFLKETKEPWYLKINPAGKIPVIIDVNATGTDAFTLAESAAILLYLAEKYDVDHKFSYPVGSKEHYKEIEFLFFHASGLNPQQAGVNSTRQLEPENKDTIERFYKGLLKSYDLVERQLQENDTGYLVGDHLSLADIIAFPHANVVHKAGVNVDQFPKLVQWLKRLNDIPEVQVALAKK